jgi:superfamily II DNA or RNA helicase
MGLSATINNNSKYIINGREYTKLQLIESIAPVVFRFTLNQALKLNIARKATIYVYAHSLDDKTQRVFNPKYPNYKKTEKEQYEYYNQAIMSIVENSKDNMGMYRPLNQADKFKLNNLRRQRAQFLYSLPSKKSAILDILSKVKGQSIVFANSLELIEKIIPNTVSINNTKEVNTRTIKAFNDKVINTIGSFKMLQQGENFEHLDNCIIASYYSSEGPSIQRIGRLRRASTEGKIIFIVTKNTQEVQWLQKILNSFGSYQISSIK